MTDMHSKRKFAGEPHKDLRTAKAPDVERLPPHKKPRTYRLTVTIEQTNTTVYVKDFPSKAAMQEARARAERVIAQTKAAEKESKSKYRRYWSRWWDLKMDCYDEKVLKSDPVITEQMLDGPADNSAGGK